MADERTFVIVGASLTGAKAAETLRADGFTGRIILIGEETERPYERPPLSKDYLLGKEGAREKAFVHEPGWYAEHDVDLRLATRVTHLNPAAHVVVLDGVDELRYDRLLLATGSRVRTLDVPGHGLHGVRYLRTLDESDALLEHLRTAANVVVIGAGWIGLETAAAARHHGANVTVVEQAALPLQKVLGDEVASVFRDLHEAHGVTFRFGTAVASFGGTGALSSVVLTDGTELPADVAVVGIGIQPNTELAVDGGLAVDNGVLVSANLATSAPDVYAAGDVVNLDHPLLGRRVRVEHWANALNGGKAAGKALLGSEQVVYDRVPYFFSDQYDLGMEYSGFAVPGEYDTVVFRGDPAVRDGKAPEFVAFWVKDGRVLAGMNANVWDVTDPIQALVRAGYKGTAVDLAKLADPDVPLDQLLD
ncbi:NAD(P)/FAD-dependent oxidoreductase [Dactylosporangium sp. CA-139114]|uniref:NAD(P)/FAD-dependent oxidoreductase n=1 Tax=Dactylosporangium sp. CA-139114 TaxID=3239931 RepID=UPI003D99B5E4